MHLLQAYESSNTITVSAPVYKQQEYYEAPASPTSVIASCRDSALSFGRSSSGHSWSYASSCSAETEDESLASEGWDNVSVTSTTSNSSSYTTSDDDQHVLLSSVPLRSYGMHSSHSDLQCNAAYVR